VKVVGVRELPEKPEGMFRGERAGDDEDFLIHLYQSRSIGFQSSNGIREYS
jgi:hypothetical protein